jgi:hypothetical protein
MGFTWTGNSSCPIRLCFIYGNRLINAVIAPAKLKQHFTINHSHMTSKSADYFKRLLESQNKRSKAFVSKVRVSEKSLGSKLFSSRIYCPEKDKSHKWLEASNSSMLNYSG